MLFFKINFGEREKEREQEQNIDVRNIDQLPPNITNQDRTCRLSMCPDGESNPKLLVYGTTF